MIRVLLGSALSVAYLAVGVAMIGPGLLTGAAAEGMVVADAQDASLQDASFEGAPCASALLLKERETAGRIPAAGRVVIYALNRSGELNEVAIRDFPGDDGAARDTLFLLFDDAGRLAAVGTEPPYHPTFSSRAMPQACATGARGHDAI
jgi:hypothetical protein